MSDLGHDQSWACPKCDARQRRFKYCLRACRIHGTLGPDGRFVVSGRLAFKAGDLPATKHEHLHVSCSECGYEVLEACRDAEKENQ